MRSSSQKLTFLKADQSMRDELKKILYQKNAILDKEFSCYESSLCQGLVKDQQIAEKNFKKELDGIVNDNIQKASMLKGLQANHNLLLIGNEVSPKKKVKAKKPKQESPQLDVYSIKVLEKSPPRTSNFMTEDQSIKRSFFHSPITEDMISMKRFTQESIKDFMNKENAPALSPSKSKQQSPTSSPAAAYNAYKNVSEQDQLKLRFSDIINQLESVEQEAIFQNSTNDQYKFKAKKYQSLITAIRKKNAELRSLIEMADSRYSNLVEHTTLSKQQMKDELKILQEAEEETLQLKQNIRDLEKQTLLSHKKKVCEIMMRIEYLNQQTQTQHQAIERLDDQRTFLLEQKQLSCYVEQNIDSLTKLKKKLYLMDECYEGSLTLIGLSSPLTPSKKRISKLSPLANKGLFMPELNSVDDLDSQTSRSEGVSPRIKRFSSQQITRSKKNSVNRQSSLQSERNRVIDKINRFCENDPEELVNKLAQIYSQYIFESQSLQSQFEFLQKQKISLDQQHRKLDIEILNLPPGDQQYLNQAQKVELHLNGNLVGSKESEEKEFLEIEIDKIEDAKNESEKILVSTLYFLLQTLKKHKRLIDEVHDKGEVEPSSDHSFDKLEFIDTLIEKYQKGFMKKKIFEQYNNKKKYQKNTLSQIISSRNHLSILIPKDPKNTTENIAQMRDSFITKEKFFFFKDQHNYFPLTFKELKETLYFIFPKSFMESVIEIIIDLTSKDILVRFFMGRDDIIEVGEHCINSYEHFKQFNMILSSPHQLTVFAKKQKNIVPQGKNLHGSRRLSQYSPLKNPLYILQKDDLSPAKIKKDKSFALKLDLQSIQLTNSVTNLNIDHTPKLQDKQSINIIDADQKDKNKLDLTHTPQSSNGSIDISKGSLNEVDGIDSKRSSSESSSEMSDSGKIQETKNSPSTKNLKALLKAQSPHNTMVYDEAEELDQDEREEQAQKIKEQEQAVLGSFIILEMQKRAIKNFKKIIKEVVDSEKVIFDCVTHYKDRNSAATQNTQNIRPELIQFNQNQLQQFIAQAERTLQYKKQREQMLNERLSRNKDGSPYYDEEDEKDINEEEEDEHDSVIQQLSNLKKGFNSRLSIDTSTKYRQYFSDLLSPISTLHKPKDYKRFTNDSFIMEESQFMATNESIQMDQSKGVNEAKKKKRKLSELIVKEDLERAKDLIVMLTQKNKSVQPKKESNKSLPSFKFKKLEQPENLGESQQNISQKDFAQRASQISSPPGSSQKIVGIISKTRTKSKLQAFQEQKRNQNKKEKEYINSQRLTIKKDNSSQQLINPIKSSHSLSNQDNNQSSTKNLKMLTPQSEFNKLPSVEQQFYQSLNKEDQNIIDLNNKDYFIDYLKTFHNDAYFLQKLYILGKNSNNIPLSKKNEQLELPKGLNSTKYFEKLKAYEKQQYMGANKSKSNSVSKPISKQESDKNANKSQEEEDKIKKQTEECKKPSQTSTKSQTINMIYKTNSHHGSSGGIYDLIKDGKKALDNLAVNSVELNIQDQKGRKEKENKKGNQSNINASCANEKTSKVNNSQVNNVLEEYGQDKNDTKQYFIKFQDQNEKKDLENEDKFKQKMDEKLDFVKSKNQKSLQQLKKIFNIDQGIKGDKSKSKKQNQSSNSSNCTIIESKKNSISFQSRPTALASMQNSQNTSSELLKSYPNKLDFINTKKPVFATSLVISTEEKTITQQQALQKIIPKPSPYGNILQLNKIFERGDKIKHMHQKSQSQPKIDLIK